MLDFTSSLYLGMRHASHTLRPWAQLTTGVPAALRSPPNADAVVDRLAHLIGCERATLGPSTLHLFWDLFGLLVSERIAIYVDAGVYPIAWWGVERAVARGAPMRTFPHHDADALRQLLKHDRYRRRSPLIVADGFCPGCGRHAPIAAYLDGVRAYGGQLIIDDTQAVGIFGHPAGADALYGKGGGGSLRWCDISRDGVTLIASLAKGLGVPMAVLAGSRATIRHFEAMSQTRVHCSPPSIATLHAAEHALNMNERHGDELRLRLAQRVKYFRGCLREIGLEAAGDLFPVQTLRLAPTVDVIGLHKHLLDRGIQTVLHRGRRSVGPRLSFMVTARHQPDDIDQAVNGIVHALSTAQQQESDHATYYRLGGRTLRV